MTDIDFEPFPKIPRLNRGMLISEKIDGTNAAVIIAEDGRVAAQSRNRLITPDADNYGFARWAYENAGALADTLGPGRHFGEWWGSGIQRGYGLTGGDKRFSLFNTSRWSPSDLDGVDGLGVVPVLRAANFSTEVIEETIAVLKANGSAAAPGYDRPEGIVVWLSAARTFFKVLAENDDIPKGLAA